jgi:large subunit ribosomal protein L7/L12
MRRITSLSSGAIFARCCASAPPTDAKLDQMADMYAQLTLKEVSQLQRLVFKKLGHSDKFYEEALLKGLGGGGGGGGMMMPVAAAGAVPAAAAVEEAAPEPVKEKKKIEKNSFDVKLAAYKPEIKIKLIKELRAVTNLALKEAKDAIDKAPGIVATNIVKEDAEKLKKLFTDLGADVELL